jgi:acetyl-CoA/propionyl-CoA carboxylase biotin carboxyl carrier protein
VVSGSVIGGAFDSMLAKLIVTGRDRTEALQRARRALAEFVVEGLPTVLPFHRAVVSDPAFAPEDAEQPFAVHTRWIETEFRNTIEPWVGESVAGDTEPRERMVVEVGGKRLEVVVPAGFGIGTAAKPKKAPKRAKGGGASASAGGDGLVSPMQGTIVKVAVEDGQRVEAGELVVVLEAMKMEQPLTAHKSGTVTALNAEVGRTVTAGALICELKN